jgi:zinc/manganese transport system substrate-binding protein
VKRLVLVGLTTVLLAGCGIRLSGEAARPGVVRVVAAENFWGDIARQLGGTHAEVRSLVSDPAADPHLFEADARAAEAVADAAVVIENGLGYDDWMHDLLSSTSGGKHVVSAAGAMGASGDGTNPHLWYDIVKVPKVARAITDALAAVDPADRAAFQANLARFDASLQPVRDALAAIKRAHDGAPVAYTERVPEYLLHDIPLSVVTPAGFAQSIEDGSEPNARDTKAMEDLIRHHDVKALLYNAQATSPVTQRVRALADHQGVPVVAVTETMPKNEPSYQDWMLHEVQALAAALGR